MTPKTISKSMLVAGTIFILLSLVIFIFADGLRRWYSGLFFAIMGVVALLYARRWREESSE